MTAKTTVTIEAVYPDGTDLTNRLVVVQLIHGGAGGTVDGQLIAERTIVPLTGDSDDWSVDLYPTAAISPAGCFYQFTIDNSSPTIVRDISVPSSGPVSWTDDAILLEDPAPPVTVPAAVSGDPLDVLRVKADGSGYELAPPEGGGGDALVISTAEPADPGVGADGAAWVRPPGDMRVFADFRVMPDGPIPDESNGWFPEDPATLVSFHSYPAPFQPCVVIDGAVQSDMVTTVDPGVDDSTRTGFAVIAEPGETGRVEWGHGGYAEPNDADMVAYVTSNVAISDNSGNAYLFDVVVGRVDPLTGDIDTGEAVSAGLRLIRDDLAAPTSIGWHPLDAIPVAGERFGFSWDNATGELVGYHNGEAVMTATDTTHDISTFTSVGMPLHQTNDDADEIAYFVRVAWIGVSAGDPVDPDSIGTHTWNGTAWVPALTADEVADIAAMRPATGGGGTVDVVSNVAANTILGRTTAGSGDSEELTASAVRALLDLEPGTDVQAYHANLAALAGLSLIADRLPYANGTGTLDLATLTAYGRSLVAAADAAAARALLGGWQTISRKTLASNSASESFTITGYKMIRVTVTARSTRTASGTDTLRMRFNGDTGSNYSTIAGGLTTYAVPANVSASNTNTDRLGYAVIQWAYAAAHRLYGFGTHTAPASTATGSDAGQTWAFTWLGAASAAPTSVEFYCGNGDIAAGSEFLVEGYV